MQRSFAFHLWALFSLLTPSFAASAAADRVYRNGTVFTADANHFIAQAIAIREGRIIYVGSNQGVVPLIGASTKVTDLEGRFLMPGLVDGHLHPLEAGMKLEKCSLNYDSLTVAQFEQRIQACLEQTRNQEPDGWLEVVNWFQESMRPAGVKTSRATLDGLPTSRPIIVRSSFGHTVLANSRALAMAKITRDTPDPVGGKIWRDGDGNPTGLLEDSAFATYSDLIPKPTPEENIAAAKAAQQAMNRQGVTSFLDADAAPESMAAFTAVQAAGALTVRAHFAPQIAPTEASDPATAVANVVRYQKQYDQGGIEARPGLTVRNAKLFLDGVIAAPALTGAVLEPYRTNLGTQENPHWVAGQSRGPSVYFPPRALAEILVRLGRAGIDPHMHADGDAAVRAALDAVEAMRKEIARADIRPAVAHDEIVSPDDYPRFKALNTIPVLSFQWEKPAGDTIGLTNYFGPERMKILEPAGLLAAAGARIAFGSDWPVDPLDEWFAFKVGVTRTNAANAAAEFHGKLGDDPGLSREAVLRAATIDAAYELHEEDVTGSLVAGKFADVIVLDRDPFKIPAEDIANVQVLETVVGGRTVYQLKPQP
ncbi:MAG TPA: amidohydrolase [Terriglobales bacterium]|nr:amidohydrolase [Terriglobales bacterium]